jgi:hypothetical protein
VEKLIGGLSQLNFVNKPFYADYKQGDGNLSHLPVSSSKTKRIVDRTSIETDALVINHHCILYFWYHFCVFDLIYAGISCNQT